MRKIITSVIAFALSLNAFSQTDSTKNWKCGGDVGLNTSQTSFINWAQGGQNAVSGMSFLHLFANYNKDKFEWVNYANFEYGLTQQGNEITKKTNDLMEVGTKLGYKAANHWYYTGLLSFKSQFTRGYDYDNYVNKDTYISNFLAPAYIMGGIGMDYKPNDKLSLYMSPVTMKYTIVKDSLLAVRGAYGVQAAEFDDNGLLIKNYKTTRLELGAYLRFMYKNEIAKNVNFATTLDLYSNYLHNPQNIDVDWEVEIIMKVNSWLNASIRTHLIYDDDIKIANKPDENGNVTYSPKTQFNEAIAVGFIYKFGN